eukprot:2050914-Lingulodinium_polyedra.AAC.1
MSLLRLGILQDKAYACRLGGARQVQGLGREVGSQPDFLRLFHREEMLREAVRIVEAPESPGPRRA